LRSERRLHELQEVRLNSVATDLVPVQPFTLAFDVGLVAASVGALWIGAKLLVENAARLARRAGLSELVVGLTVVGFGTSTPELATSVNAALIGAGDIAVGKNQAEPTTLRSAVVAPGGLALILVGARLLVASATDLARLAGVSEWAIGETVVAVGTSTPEFAASVVAARRGMSDLAAGNLIGSNVFNVLGILGTAALVRPLSVSPVAFDATL
jgi:cation:H+ antiporter